MPATSIDKDVYDWIYEESTKQGSRKRSKFINDVLRSAMNSRSETGLYVCPNCGKRRSLKNGEDCDVCLAYMADIKKKARTNLESKTEQEQLEIKNKLEEERRKLDKKDKENDKNKNIKTLENLIKRWELPEYAKYAGITKEEHQKRLKEKKLELERARVGEKDESDKIFTIIDKLSQK